MKYRTIMKFPFALFIVIAIALHGQAQASMDAPVPSTLLIADSYIVTFKRGSLSVPPLVLPVDPQNLTKIIPKFGENGTGQSKEALANSLGVKGVVVSIFETINAAGIQMSASEAEKLRKDPRVLRVEQNMTGSVQTTQLNPGWGLDRIDQSSINLNNQYIYNADGTGQTVYILDTGLDLTNPLVVAEFGSRATVSWDVNNSTGQDCNGHGTRVASLVGGNIYGLAKGATIVVEKITSGCTGNSSTNTWAAAFNWLAANAPRGTIVNLSSALSYGANACGQTAVIQAVEDTIRAAYNAGIIVVVAAGNDSCDTANYTPTRIPEAFVVGATDKNYFSSGIDALASYSRTGSNISVFAPGTDVNSMNFNGIGSTGSGTSFSSPYMAGMFAVGCQVVAPFCSTASSTPNAGTAYTALRNIGAIGTVFEPDGSPLPSGTTSRFISRSPW